MRVREAAETGDRKTALVALRDTLATAIDNAVPSEVAPLVRQMSDVLRQIEKDFGRVEEDAGDQLARRRAERQAARRRTAEGS